MERLCQDKNKIAIVGAGPAGIFCAICAVLSLSEYNFTNYSIDIFEQKNPLLTLLPTGNGRCNITNSLSDVREFASNYPRGEKFLISIFSRFSNLDTLDLFKKIGIKTHTEADGRIFPKSNSSKDVRNSLLKFLKKYPNINFINSKINSAKKLKDYDYLVISAGSRGTEKLIKSFNHSCIDFRKSLCQLKIKDFNYPKGVSVSSLDGDFVFTEDGISGPLAFKISSINAFSNFPYEVSIKLFDYDDLLQDIENNPRLSIGNLISKYVPKSLAKVIVKDYSKHACEISKSEIKSYSFLNLTVTGLGNKGEIVNAGGVDLNELDKNCKSKIFPNLWFCGEILNIDGFCGGFNLQNCWSTAYIVAKDIAESIMYHS